TPIPRTLHMSLSGIRDMSVIEEPPQERHPVITYVTESKESVIITKKGKGYRFAEEQPDKYHGVSKFDIKTGVTSAKVKSMSTSV
ncbi:hypothetical protein ACTPEF_25900, partial [Clostridioides difficile]